MSHPTPNWHPYGHTHADNLALLAAGDETGWYDETGRPAPWPDNFLDPDAGWTSATWRNDQNLWMVLGEVTCKGRTFPGMI